MAKKRIVHYINQFFAGIGGEDHADYPPEVVEGVRGPGLALGKLLGEDAEIVATVICGDNYFGTHIETGVVQQLLDMIRPYSPDGFIAGPAFNAGRYGVACGTITKAVEEELGIPAVTGMYPENPGADMFKKDIHIIETKNSSADMRRVAPIMAKLLMKKMTGQEILGPQIEGYIERGIRVNYFNERRGAARAVELLVKKINGEEVYTDYPMPKIDRVAPAPALTKPLSQCKIAIVTSGGVVPQGNPDHIESSNATKWGKYSIAGMDHADKADFMTVHGGYDRAFVLEDPDLCIPVDVLRQMEREGKIGKLADYFCATTGTGTATNSAKRFGQEIAPMLKDDGIDAVILTSTWGTCTRCGATMVKEIDRAGIPVVHICTVVPISLTIGANRIVPAVGIPHPLGDPRLGEPKSTQIRYEIVEKALQTLTEPVDKQTVFNWQ